MTFIVTQHKYQFRLIEFFIFLGHLSSSFFFYPENLPLVDVVLIYLFNFAVRLPIVSEQRIVLHIPQMFSFFKSILCGTRSGRQRCGHDHTIRFNKFLFFFYYHRFLFCYFRHSEKEKQTNQKMNDDRLKFVRLFSSRK